MVRDAAASMHRRLSRAVALGLTATFVGGLSIGRAQERPVPSDSARVSIPGCAEGRVFTVTFPPQHEPSRSDIAAGRHFRLSGDKEALNDIKKHEGQLIEVTGLVRKNALTGPGGIPVAGGRVRIGAGVPQAPTADPSHGLTGYDQAVLDVEGWRQLGENCSVK